MLEEIKAMYQSWSKSQSNLPEYSRDKMKAFLSWVLEHPEQYSQDQRLSLGWAAHRLQMI